MLHKSKDFLGHILCTKIYIQVHLLHIIMYECMKFILCKIPTIFTNSQTAKKMVEHKKKVQCENCAFELT